MKVAVLTDTEAAAGYRLAGMAVFEAADPEAARTRLAELVQRSDFALVAVDSALVPDPYQAVKREMRGRDLPVLLSIAPLKAAIAGGGEDAGAYIRKLIIETMGYEIKL